MDLIVDGKGCVGGWRVFWLDTAARCCKWTFDVRKSRGR